MTVAQILVYFSAQMKCTDVQSASLGCSTCPCALESSCNAVRSYPGSYYCKLYVTGVDTRRHIGLEQHHMRKSCAGRGRL